MVGNIGTHREMCINGGDKGMKAIWAESIGEENLKLLTSEAAVCT